MKHMEIDSYRYYDPVFEGVRVVLTQMGEPYTPEYILGISGSAFKIAAGCPSRPTCVCDFWPADFLRYLGYEISEHPCFDAEGKDDVTPAMVEAVKKSVNNGRPALVFHAFRDAEWDVVCGYDEGEKQFIGKGTSIGGYARQPWERAKTCGNICPAFGAVVIENKTTGFSAQEAEIRSLKSAVAHGRKETGDPELYKAEGIQAYKQWAAVFSAPGADRGVADAYCYDAYSSVRKAAVIYVNGLAAKYGKAALFLQGAAEAFSKEVEALEKARPYISWVSPWGVDEARSKALFPLLSEAATAYEKGIEFLEKALVSIA